MSRKVILYIAASLDGYIAKSNDDLSFLNAVQREGEDYGYQEFMRSVDTVILGRKTYDWVMTQVEIFPHAELQTFVITSNKLLQWRYPGINYQSKNSRWPKYIY